MARLRIRSLYLTVVLPTVALVLASMAVVAYAARHAMQEGVRVVAAQRAQYALAYTKNSIEDLEHVMRVDHGIKLQDTLERLGSNPDLDAVRVLSRTGKVLHSSRTAEVGSLMPAHLPKLPEPLPEDRDDLPPQVRELPGLVHTAAPIFNKRRCARCHADDGPILGFVDVDISLSRQSAGMKTWAEIAGIASVIQFGIIAAGIALILGFVVVRPIRRLERSMGEVALGNYAVAAGPAGTRELDSLVDGFNDMVGRLRRADELEQEAQRVKMVRAEQLATFGEMAASLAHELRNPLSGIKAAVDVLAGEEPAAEPRGILRQVSEELARVDGVVKQLLDYARPKAPVFSSVDLRELLTDAIALSGPQAAAQGVTVEVELRSDATHVMADADMVRQMAVNLLLNAFHAVEGVSDGRIVVSTRVAGARVDCLIRDNGPGVPPDRADSIFRPFVTTRARGTGLGLATSRRLAELQDGGLWLENPGEPGACFIFSLPLVGADTDA